MSRGQLGVGLAPLFAILMVACGNGSDGVDGPGSGGADAGQDGGTGGSNACKALPAGPIEPMPVLSLLSGSQDFAFDGKGHIVAKQGPNIVFVDAAQQVTNFASLPGPISGLRYRPDGNLVVSRPLSGEVDLISPSGTVSPLVTELLTPSGVYADAGGNVWITESSGDKVDRINPDGTLHIVVKDPPAVQRPGAVLYDARRKKLFYTNLAFEVRFVDTAAPVPAPSLVATIKDSQLEGLVMDACGNLYAIDSTGSQLYRLRLTADGALVDKPEQLAHFTTPVANAAFGAGPGFDPKTLYVIGAPGSMYAVPVGIAGAAVPFPP